MKKNNGYNSVDPKESAWKLFEKTGDTTFYRLYKKLEQIDKGE